MSNVLHSDAIERLARREAKRKERNVMGAWRAGYDYLHVCERHKHAMGRNRKLRFIPSDDEKPPERPYIESMSWKVTTYDLRWLFPQDVRAIKEGTFTGNE